MLGRLGRLWRTVRWLRPIQWRYRLWYAVERRLRSWAARDAFIRAVLREGRWHRGPKEARPTFFPRKNASVWPLEAEGEQIQRAMAVSRGEFTFANETRAFSGMPEWLPRVGAGRFWEYNLHYFDYAVDLAAAYQQTGHQGYLNTLRALILDWIGKCHLEGKSIAYDAGPLSHRLKNWSRVCLALGEELYDDELDPATLGMAMLTQGQYLENHCEFQLLGNHLITNGAALLFVGALFQGKPAERRVRKGLRILRSQLREQFLPDGGHEERSPMYHALMLKDYLDCLGLERHLGAQWFDEEDREQLRRAVRFFVKTLHPDGEIALLNDAATGIAPKPLKLLKHAQNVLAMPGAALEANLGSVALAHTGWYVLRDETSFLIYDAGDVGPDHNPAHAHGDTLSFELSIGEQRVIVDSGTYGYGGDDWQAYCVSTRAHNTVVIDGEEQIEKWGPRYFRAGRRPHAQDAWMRIWGETVVFNGSHDGYDHLPGRPRHRRQVVRVRPGEWVVVDEITGDGKHAVESFLHFHPAVKLRAEEGRYMADWSEGCLSVRPIGGGGVAHGEGWYCPEFGIAQKNTVLCLRVEEALPMRFGWLLNALAD